MIYVIVKIVHKFIWGNNVKSSFDGKTFDIIKKKLFLTGYFYKYKEFGTDYVIVK